MLISDLPARSALMSHNRKLKTKPFGEPLTRGDRQETFIENTVSANRGMPGNRDLLKVVRGRPFDSWGRLWFFVKKKIVQQIFENK